VKRAVDTSVLVAAFASWHANHLEAVAELATKPLMIAHAMIETYSVLTRLPEPQRARPHHVAEFLSRNFTESPLSLDAEQLRSIPERLSELAVVGGATYDALIALTASKCGAHLVSLDRRAEAVYRRCGVSFELLGA
jgi:predicted nucleic acid-binding protein